MVTAIQLPVRRPELSLAFWGFAVCLREFENLGNGSVSVFRHNL